jgi:hypothetical protein
LDDEWEKFRVRFTVFYPIDQPGDKLQVQVGTKTNADMQLLPHTVIDLHKAPKHYNWMQHKYGQMMSPWVGYMMLPNVVSGDDG